MNLSSSVSMSAASNGVTRPRLAGRFGVSTRTYRSETALDEAEMHAVAPSIFAAGKHESRSSRYAYIPTIEVLRGLAREGFRPFMVAQGASRIEGRGQYTKHLVRLRHAGDIGRSSERRAEANEIILINSHDGASSYQMMAGLFRLCAAGHRRNYVQRQTMSSTAMTHHAKAARQHGT